MYLQEGEINPGDEGKVIRFEKKMSDWRQDIVGGSKNLLTREDMFVQEHVPSRKRLQRVLV
jgi:hypothetical protein